MSRIQNLELIPVTGKADDSFIGVRITGNRIRLYYPETYQLDSGSPSFRDDIISLLRTFSISGTKSDTVSGTYDSRSEESDSALLSYLWLIEDYLINGFYINRETIFRKNKGGRVNWKKTMQLQPVVSNGNIIYREFIGEVKNPSDNILVDIHKHCLKKSMNVIGWLFNLNPSNIETGTLTSGLKKEYLKVLNKELELTFDDIKKERLRHMLDVLQGLDEKSGKDDFTYGVDSYHYIFERMVDSIFSSVKNMESYCPGAEWILETEGYEIVHASRLRPDTILNYNNSTFVLDSKYYRYGFTGNPGDLPETTSIQKQITYGEFIHKEKPSSTEKTYNAFILPYNKEKNVFRKNGGKRFTNNIEYIGTAKSLWKKNDMDHEIIYAFLIDLKHVIKCWNRHNHYEDIERISSEIIRKSGDIND